MASDLTGLTPGGTDATYKWLAHFGVDGALPADGGTPVVLYKGDGTATPISITATKLFVNGIEVNAAKNKLDAAIAPTVDDDVTLGYSVGSKWYDLTAQEAYLCFDATDGAAVWEKATLTADELGSAAFTASADFATAAQGTLATTAAQQSVTVRNNSGSLIPFGTAVQVSGSVGNTPTIALATNVSKAGVEGYIGIVTESGGIANNTNGSVQVLETVSNLDTSGGIEGDEAFVGVDGTIIYAEPSGMVHIQKIGIVTNAHPTLGSIKLQPDYRGTEIGNTLKNAETEAEARTTLGLGTAAVSATGDFATAAQGAKADAALPKAGGTMTGGLTITGGSDALALYGGSVVHTNSFTGTAIGFSFPSDGGSHSQAYPSASGTIALTSDLTPLNPSGIVTRGALLAVNADPTKFDVNAGTGYLNGSLISWSTQTAITTTNLLTATRTYVYVSAAGAIVQSVDKPTPASRRANLLIGQLGHANLTTIATALTVPDSSVNTNESFNDFLRCIGPIPCDGNAVTANGANLSINLDAGYLLGSGANHEAASGTAIQQYFAAEVAPTFRRRTSTGNGTSSAFLDVANYDVAGTITSISGTRASNHRIYRLLSGNIVVQYGTATYVSIADAINGYDTETYTPFSNVTEIGTLIGVVAAKANATDLSNTAQAQFYVPSALGRASSSAPLNSTNIASVLTAATSKTTPVDADEIPLIDSADSFSLKKLTFANLKTTLTTALNALYVGLIGDQTVAGAKTFSSKLKSTTGISEFPSLEVSDATFYSDAQVAFSVNSSSKADLFTGYDNGTLRFAFSRSGICRIGEGYISRTGIASRLAIGNGTIADASGTLELANLIASALIFHGTYTVAGLPAAASNARARTFVSDSNATMTAGIGAVVAGGGANIVPVYSDGTNWRIG